MSEPPQMTYADAATLYDTLEARAAARRHDCSEASPHKPRPRRHRLGPTYALAACCSAAAILVVMVAAGVIGINRGGADRSADVPPAVDTNPHAVLGPTPAPVGSDPFVRGGQAVSLAQAPSLAGYPVPAPDSSLASSQNLSDVWLGPWPTEDGPTEYAVVLDYVSSDITITMNPAGPGFADPKAAYLKEAASIGVPASSVQTVDGSPALVVPPANGQNGFVDMDRNGTHIAVIGPHSAADLIAVADTLQS